MAQRVMIQLIDDLNNQEAQETVLFGLDGALYEIDLTAKNATELRAALSGYVTKSRKVASGPQGRSPHRGNTTRVYWPDQVPKIRQWAQDNGYTLRHCGKIPSSVIDAYNEAQT